MAESVKAEIDPLEKHLPSDSLYIFADIETDSIHANILLQIAAVALTGEQFNKFINPGCPLSQNCTNFLGLYFYNGNLYQNGKLLPTENISFVLTQFSKWLQNFNKPVILVFHNGFGFDCSVLARFFLKYNIPLPANLTTVCDTLPYLRKNLKTEVPNHKLSTLASHFNIIHEHAHDALSDSLTLKLICMKIAENTNINIRELFKEGFRPFRDFIDQQSEGTPLVPLKKAIKAIFKVDSPPKQPKKKKSKKKTNTTDELKNESKE